MTRASSEGLDMSTFCTIKTKNVHPAQEEIEHLTPAVLITWPDRHTCSPQLQLKNPNLLPHDGCSDDRQDWVGCYPLPAPNASRCYPKQGLHLSADSSLSAGEGRGERKGSAPKCTSFLALAWLLVCNMVHLLRPEPQGSMKLLKLSLGMIPSKYLCPARLQVSQP